MKFESFCCEYEYLCGLESGHLPPTLSHRAAGQDLLTRSSVFDAKLSSCFHCIDTDITVHDHHIGIPYLVLILSDLKVMEAV